MYSDLFRELLSVFSGGLDIVMFLINPPNIITLDQQLIVKIVKTAMIILGVIVGLISTKHSTLFSGSSPAIPIIFSVLLGILMAMIMPDKVCIIFAVFYLSLAKIIEGILFGFGVITFIKGNKILSTIAGCIVLFFSFAYSSEISTIVATITGYILVNILAAVGLIHTMMKIEKAQVNNSITRLTFIGFLAMALAGLVISPHLEPPEKTIQSLIFPTCALIGFLVGIRKWRFQPGIPQKTK